LGFDHDYLASSASRHYLPGHKYKTNIKYFFGDGAIRQKLSQPFYPALKLLGAKKTVFNYWV